MACDGGMRDAACACCLLRGPRTRPAREWRMGVAAAVRMFRASTNICITRLFYEQLPSAPSSTRHATQPGGTPAPARRTGHRVAPARPSPACCSAAAGSCNWYSAGRCSLVYAKAARSQTSAVRTSLPLHIIRLRRTAWAVCGACPISRSVVLRARARSTRRHRRSRPCPSCDSCARPHARASHYFGLDAPLGESLTGGQLVPGEVRLGPRRMEQTIRCMECVT
jgi:hypothetical protein